MKNKYVIIGMIIITAVVVMLGVYEIINSVGYDDITQKIVIKERNELINLIMQTDDKQFKKEQIDLVLEYNKITQEKANELF